MPKRILITGVSGLLGSNLAYCWKRRHAVAGIYHTHPFTPQGIVSCEADLINPAAVDAIIDDFRPDVIVHTAALANVDACETDHSLADRLNVGLTRSVCSAACLKGIKLVHISTDAIYDGVKGNYIETDELHPSNYYAQTKLKAEQEAMRHPQSLIVRTSFYGFNVIAKKSLAEWVVDELSAGRSINGFEDAFSSNIFTFDLAVLLEQMIEHNLTGVYNAGCRDALSKYDFAREIARLFSLDGSLIKRASIDDVGFKAARGKHLGINISKLASVVPGPFCSSAESLEHFYKNYQYRFSLNG